MKQKIFQGLLGALVFLCWIASGIRLPGDSGYCYERTALDEATWCQEDKKTTKLAQPIPITPETSQAPTEPNSTQYRGVVICEGQEVPGEITHYCAGRCCNDKWAGVTKDGTVLDEDTEPVVGCQWLPFDAIVEISGKQYRVADTGGKEFETVGRLDVYVSEGHQAALNAGRQKVTIKIISLP